MGDRVESSRPETVDEDLFCIYCEKFHGPACKFKDDRAPPNKDSRACPEYEQKKTEQPYSQVPVVDSPFFNDKGVFIPALLADRIMSIHMFLTMQDSREIFVYRDGVYEPTGEVAIKVACRKLLGEEYRKNRALEVIDYIQTCTYTERKEEPVNLVPVKNGVLNLDTMQLEEFSPKRIFFNKIPVEYNPRADCPHIKQFLQDVAQTEEDARILEEAAGYCLYRSYFIPKALLLAGNGGNGKSTYLALVRAFLGATNVSARSLQELETNRFAKADLFGKLANVYSDLTNKALQTTGTFKILTGGGIDEIPAEKKFQHAFKFVNVAKLMFSANIVPSAYDDTNAYFRRWQILTFNRVFEGVSDDKNILKKLTTKEELSGFLNLALAGLKRLLVQGDFSYSKSVESTKADYIRKSSPIAAFVMDELEVDSDAFIEKKELYRVFLEYCRNNKLPTVVQDTFFKNFPREINVSDFRPKIELESGPDFRPTSLKGCRFNASGSNRSIGSRAFLSLSSLRPSYSEYSTLPWKFSHVGRTRGYIRIETPLDRVDPLDPNQSKGTLISFQKPNENRDPIRLERVQLDKEEFVQKLRETLSPDKGYTRDKVKEVLLQEGFSDSDAELKLLDLERARIITIDDANTIFLSEEKPSTLETPGTSQKTVNSEVSEVSLEGVASNAASLVRLTGLFEDKCIICGIRGRMEWQVNNHDGSWGFLCDSCGLEVEKRLSHSA
jgi:putative DNA primase/helicase